jgi:hypothetical protein
LSWSSFSVTDCSVITVFSTVLPTKVWKFHFSMVP